MFSPTEGRYGMLITSIPGRQKYLISASNIANFGISPPSANGNIPIGIVPTSRLCFQQGQRRRPIRAEPN
jgi:hypothetical protein